MGCRPTQNSRPAMAAIVDSLRFLHIKEIPFGLPYAATTVGGLSSIDYIADKDEYVLICDDRSNINPSRFYKAKIQIKADRIESVWFTGMQYLRQPSAEVFPSSQKDPAQAADPESLRFHARSKKFLWTSEGENSQRSGQNILLNPWIWFMDSVGLAKDSFPLPPNLYMRSDDLGPRTNGVLEGSGFSPDGKKLYVSLEEPLKQDGPRPDNFPQTTWLRFYAFDLKSKRNTAQWAYSPEKIDYPANPIDAFKVNGISEILPIGNQQFLVVERAFSTGRASSSVKIFLADARGATNVKDQLSLAKTPPEKPMRKKLL
ncbi:MAG: esterase-like activity of phytase family protein, partial [Sphingobacteriia bacterium]